MTQITAHSLARRMLLSFGALALLAGSLASAPATAATRVEWRAAAKGALRVEQLELARRVEGRRPADVSESFVADGNRVYAFLRVLNKGNKRKLRVVWQRGSRVYHKATLWVGRAPNWRTWAFIKARRSMAGAWTVTVEDEDGKALAKKAFTITK